MALSSDRPLVRAPPPPHHLPLNSTQPGTLLISFLVVMPLGLAPPCAPPALPPTSSHRLRHLVPQLLLRHVIKPVPCARQRDIIHLICHSPFALPAQPRHVMSPRRGLEPAPDAAWPVPRPSVPSYDPSVGIGYPAIARAIAASPITPPALPAPVWLLEVLR